MITEFVQGIFKKDYIIGLDIGSSSVKLAQFIKKEDGLHLLRLNLIEIEQTGDESASEEQRTSALRNLLKSVDLEKSKVIASINCPQTAIKKVITPYMPKSELRAGIMLEAKNYFPFPTDQSLLDFQILGDVIEQGVRKYEVVIAVSPIKTVNKYLLLLEKAGIKPAAFVPSAFLLQQSAGYAAQIKHGEARCLIDIGAYNTELIIAKGKYLVFSRKIPIAGNDFTKAMMQVLVSDRGRLQLSFEEAEKIKRQVGFPAEGESRIIDGKISTAQILSMLRAPLEQLSAEIERCLDYYREESGGSKIDSIVLFGGGASLGGLNQYLAEALGMEVRLGDSLEGIQAESEAIPERSRLSHRSEQAIGCALSGAGGINLLPAEFKDQAKKVLKRGTLEAVSAAVILILIFIFAGMKIQLSNYEKRISVGKLELSSLEPQLKIARSEQLMNKLLADEPYWEDVFLELSNLIPDNIYLTNLSMQNNIIKMKGIVVSTKDEVKLVSDFILVLERGIFNNLKLLGTRNLGQNSGAEFELRCWLDSQ